MKKIKPSKTKRIILPPPKTRRIDPEEFLQILGAEPMPEEGAAKLKTKFRKH